MKASFALTEKGPVRQDNQDAYLIDSERGVFAVADGLGGLPNGARASRMALEILQNCLNESPLSPMEHVIDEVNQRSREFGFAMDAAGFGTTLTMGRVTSDGTSVEIAHVGDSAAYLVEEGSVRCLTREHTVAARMMAENWQDASEAIPLSAHHTLTQCIGQNLYIEPEVATFPIQPGARLFLLTDGVTKPLGEEALASVLLGKDPVGAICQRLSFKIEMAGAPDNYTIVAVEF